jgi:hypothetical protein
MKILYLWFYARSFPDYPQVAAALRRRGHEAWVGSYDEAGDVAWLKGDERVATVAGPGQAPRPVARVPGLRSLWQWLLFWRFMLRLRAFFRRQGADVVPLSHEESILQNQSPHQITRPKLNFM